MSPGNVYHSMKHAIDSIKVHKPVSGAVENEITTFDSNGLPVKKSGIQIGDITGGLIPQGDWEASTNTPALANGIGTVGNFYTATDSGDVDFGSGIISFSKGDYAVYTSALVWVKQDNTQNIHAIGGALHSSDTLANLNSKITDTDAIGADGSVPFTGDQSMGGNKVTNCPSVEGPAASDCGIESGVGFDTFSKMGDDAGVNAHEFRDSTDAVVAKVDSNGVGDFYGADMQNRKITSVQDPTAAQEADTLAARNAAMAYTKQSNVYFVSGLKGNDANDGSMFRPLATPLKAIQLGMIEGYDQIFIMIDMTYDYAQFQCPDEAIASFKSWGSGYTDNGVTLILGEDCELSFNDVTVAIKEKVGQTGAWVILEETTLAYFSDSAGTGNPTNTYANTTNAFAASSIINRLKNCAGWKGNAINKTTGETHFSNGIDLNNQKAENQANGTIATDGMAFGQKYTDGEAGIVADGKIATHTATPAAHHAKYLDSEAITAMGGKVDGNPLNHDRPIQATESVIGIAEIATQTETNTGTDDTKTITPAKLANRVGQMLAKRTAIADANYTILITDYIVAFTSLTATRTITLPTPDGKPRVFIIKDEAGKADAYPITIDPLGAVTIDGISSIQLTTPYSSTIIYTDGSNYFTKCESNTGQVKINTGNSLKPTITVTAGNVDTLQKVQYASPLGLSSYPTNKWPQNIDSPSDSDIYDSVNHTFIENTILGQIQHWRLIVSFSGKVNADTAVRIKLSNPKPPSTFVLEDVVVLTKTLTSGIFQVTFTSIADGLSVPAPIGNGQGYEIELTSDGACVFVVESLTRISEKAD